MTAPERRGPERPGPEYPPEWDNEPIECHHVWSDWIDMGACDVRECFDCGTEEWM